MSLNRAPHRIVQSAAAIVSIVGLAVAATKAAPREEPRPASQQIAQEPAPVTAATELELRTQATLGLRSVKVMDIHMDREPGKPIVAPIMVENQARTLALVPNSVRSPNYQVRAQVADGSYVTLESSVNRMLRGSLLEVPGSHVAGGMMEDGLYASILMPDGERLWIEPIAGRVPGAGIDAHMMYRNGDAICKDGDCGVIGVEMEEQMEAMAANDGAGNDGASLFCAEVAIDADVEFYTQFGSNVTSVENRANLIINTLNLQYINQVDIQHVISHIIVRTAEPDPYTTTNSGILLDQLANHWVSQQGAVPRDVTHLFTGKNLDGTTIGIAFLSGICNINSNAYSLVENEGNLSCATDLSAHELGHNWSAQHCSAACSSTMNAGLTCANTFANSNPDSATQIINFRNTRTCLGACEDATLPFFDDFPALTFDTAKWASISGATVSTVGIAEPSAPNSMRLRGQAGGGHEARTARIDTSGYSQLQVQYHYQRTGGGNAPEVNEDLLVEFFNNTGTWSVVSFQPGSGPNMTTFTQATANFPASAFHSEFRLRFRNLSVNSNSDDWFVDNVSITGVAPPSNDNCSSAPIVAAGAHAFTTVAATTDGPTEPGCGFAGDSQIHSDVWYRFLSPCDGTATISLCGASFNTRIAVYSVCPAGSGTQIACNDDFCGTASEISFPVNFNFLYRIRIGGVSGATGSGSMVISCSPDEPTPCPEDVSDDGAVGVPDLLAVINTWGPCPGCPTDFNDDDAVGVPDLLAVINAWGPCPE